MGVSYLKNMLSHITDRMYLEWANISYIILSDCDEFQSTSAPVSEFPAHTGTTHPPSHSSQTMWVNANQNACQIKSKLIGLKNNCCFFKRTYLYTQGRRGVCAGKTPLGLSLWKDKWSAKTRGFEIYVEGTWGRGRMFHSTQECFGVKVMDLI